MDDTLILGCGQAHKLELGFRRTGWVNKEIEALASRDVLRDVRQVVLGNATIARAAIEPPKNGRIHILTLPVDGNADWKAAVASVGPHTSPGWPLWSVDDQYPAEGRTGFREIVLVNFGAGSYTLLSVAMAWAKRRRLRRETPRATFAVAKYRPFLYEELSLEGMGFISTIPCSFAGFEHIPCTWLYPARRHANLGRVENDWNDDYWFVFGRE